MSIEKRKVNTDALETLGAIIQDGGRDAIHLAVEPVIAAEDLKPGEDIGLVNGEASTKADKMLGIVDPFIKGAVPKGSKFWLIVYPRQITSLRHVWSHPDFSEEVTKSTSTSVQWMMDWAKQHMSYDYYGDTDSQSIPDEQAFAMAIRAGREHELGPYEEAREYIDDTWWTHWEAITCEVGDRENYFHCAC